MTKEIIDQVFNFVEETFNYENLFEVRLNTTNNTIDLYIKNERRMDCFATIYIASILEYLEV